ncbi:MAG TPA: aminotransferase class V-fold PLP-dependent enzyme [Kofleriaceae bacterium]|jgi:cysteine desulfurase|nr:aminotransferase class V-fold PLP-dependent enzyme [Kofleriaceae bacterium]
MSPLYLDNAASTRINDEVLAAMTEVMRTAWGNPSAQHPQGALARTHIETARRRLLTALGDLREARPIGNIVWTSGCTEADVLAVLGAARRKPGSIVLSSIEHPAVTTLAAQLGESHETVHVDPGSDGVIDPEAVARAAHDAAVVAIVMVQNEIGVVQPVAEIIRAVRRANPACHIHIDAAQAFGKIALDVSVLGADSVAIASHKLHGPKGVGALWLSSSATIAPLWVGGGQQGGLRGGTQDAPGVTGLGLAAERAVAALPEARTRWLGFASRITTHLTERGVAFHQLVPDHRRSPHILALGFAGVPASALRTVLASRGVYISTGSACAEREGDTHTKPSPVLLAIGLPPDTGMCRLSFGLDTTAADIDLASRTLGDVALELAQVSRSRSSN